ncbi:DUF7017 domain-containing protein [Planococcus salinus]|uniref:TOTE conflict systems S1/CSD-like domain-containing protein n=1 Tax=Planococcus salinus TaxID=1848460 RepID=A0A3M8P7D6_9BACL|nr:hypothetical protein [Planococcus salinus]RNF39599.1 hypothetical protein EEX84_08995 [Planococcus salinus]
MYTKKNLNNDLYQICTKFYVKYKLLSDFLYHRIDQDEFVEMLEDTGKEDTEIDEILIETEKLFKKVHENGGELDLDPIEQAKKLRAKGESAKALNTIVPYLKENTSDKDAILTFGWIMYDFLKEAEKEIEDYIKRLTYFNDHAAIPYDTLSGDKYIRTLTDSYLWSIRRVIVQGEGFADKVLPQLLRFIGRKSIFIENRNLNVTSKPSASRFLIKEFLGRLNGTSYLEFMDTIGFDWFAKEDFQKTIFKNDEGEEIEIRPLAEEVLSSYAKKLISLDTAVTTEQRINLFIEVLDLQIQKNPSFDWLPYHKVKLLMKVNRREEAFETLIPFARTKNREFWIWGLISELVNDDKERFYCLCAGLLCKSKPEMTVGLQEKIVPILVEKRMFSNAKFELDKLISNRMATKGKIPQQLERWKEESWYSETKAVKSRENLKEFAKKAENILYQTLPFTDIFVTYNNEAKNVIHFAYFSPTLKEGYFYAGAFENSNDWEADKVLKVKMLADEKREGLFNVYDISLGNKEFSLNFIKNSKGYVNKFDIKPFAFVNDIFISPKLVEQNQLKNYDQIEYICKRRFNRKKNTWGWAVEEIVSIIRDEDLG